MLYALPYTLPKCFYWIIRRRQRQLFGACAKTHWNDEAYCHQAASAALTSAESAGLKTRRGEKAGRSSPWKEFRGAYVVDSPILFWISLLEPRLYGFQVSAPSPEEIRTYAEYLQKTPCRLPYRRKRIRALLELLFYVYYRESANQTG